MRAYGKAFMADDWPLFASLRFFCNARYANLETMTIQAFALSMIYNTQE